MTFFASMLDHFSRVSVGLRKLFQEQARQGAEQVRQGEELLLQGKEHIRQRAILDEILSAVTLPSADQLQLTGDVEGATTTGDQKMRLSESQQGTLTLTATHKGKPAKLDGKPVWTVQAGMESSIVLEVAEDAMSANVKGVEFADTDPNVKSLSILVSADADLAADVKTLEASASIELIRDEADVLALGEGAVTDQ